MDLDFKTGLKHSICLEKKSKQARFFFSDKILNNFQSKKLSFNAVFGCFRNAMMSDALPVLFGAVEDTF